MYFIKPPIRYLPRILSLRFFTRSFMQNLRSSNHNLHVSLLYFCNTCATVLSSTGLMPRAEPILATAPPPLFPLSTAFLIPALGLSCSGSRSMTAAQRNKGRVKVSVFGISCRRPAGQPRAGRHMGRVSMAATYTGTTYTSQPRHFSLSATR